MPKHRTVPIEEITWFAPGEQSDQIDLDKLLEHLHEHFRGRIQYCETANGGIWLRPDKTADRKMLDSILWEWYGDVFVEIENEIILLL